MRIAISQQLYSKILLMQIQNPVSNSSFFKLFFRSSTSNIQRRCKVDQNIRLQIESSIL